MKITAIVPIYNVEEYLEECLESLIHQINPFDEIILINDGSTDHSANICVKYCQAYSNIKFISQENKGLGAVRNIGMANATGDYIVFIDSDDYVSRNMCQKIKESIYVYAVDVLYYNALMQYDIPSNERPMTHSAELDYCMMKGKEYLYKVFPENHTFSACLSAYRKDFLKGNNIYFSEDTYFEDNLFSLKVSLEAQSVCSISDKLYIRRCRGGSITMGEVNIKKCSDIVTVQCSLWKCLKENEIDIDNTDFTGRFILGGMLFSLEYLNQMADVVFKKSQIKKLIYAFFKNWMTLFYEKKLSFDQTIALLTILNEAEKWDEEEKQVFANTFYGSAGYYLAIQSELRMKLKTEAVERIKELPLYKKGTRVGIYGIGRHTQALLNLCRKLVGGIQCNLCFIVTERMEDKYLGYPLLSPSECKNVIDVVILSSKTYQQGMKETLIKAGIEAEKVISLYQRGDICDWIMLNEILTN